MLDTDFKDKFLECCKLFNIPIEISSQLELHFNSIELSPAEKEDIANCQCLVWLGSNRDGRKHGLMCNQAYIAPINSSKVKETIPLTFEEVYHIWEAYNKGETLEMIWNTHSFNFENVGLSHIRLMVATLQQGLWDYFLNYVDEDRYMFDFKKYIKGDTEQ